MSDSVNSLSVADNESMGRIPVSTPTVNSLTIGECNNRSVHLTCVQTVENVAKMAEVSLPNSNKSDNNNNTVINSNNDNNINTSKSPHIDAIITEIRFNKNNTNNFIVNNNSNNIDFNNNSMANSSSINDSVYSPGKFVFSPGTPDNPYYFKSKSLPVSCKKRKVSEREDTVSDLPSQRGPVGESSSVLENASYADIIRRVIQLEDTCLELKASNGLLRQQVIDLQSRTREKIVSTGSLKLAVPTSLMEEFTEAMDVGVEGEEQSWSEVVKQRKAGSKVHKAKVPTSRSLATSSLISKAAVSKAVQEELGKRDRSSHIVLSGLPFSGNNGKSDEDIVEAFFVGHSVTATFTTVKKVKSKVEPEITRIMVVDVGSVSVRDGILRTVKPRLKGGLVFVNVDKSTEELREDFKLREEVRLLTKNLSEEQLKTTRYCVRHGKIFNVGNGKFDRVSPLSTM